MLIPWQDPKQSRNHHQPKKITNFCDNEISPLVALDWINSNWTIGFRHEGMSEILKSDLNVIIRPRVINGRRGRPRHRHKKRGKRVVVHKVPCVCGWPGLVVEKGGVKSRVEYTKLGDEFTTGHTLIVKNP